MTAGLASNKNNNYLLQNSKLESLENFGILVFLLLFSQVNILPSYLKSKYN